MLAQHFHWRNVVLELAYGALAYFAVWHLGLSMLVPAVPKHSQPVVALALFLVVPLLLNTWRYVAWVRRGGHLASAFAITLNWAGYVFGFAATYVYLQLPLLLGTAGT